MTRRTVLLVSVLLSAAGARADAPPEVDAAMQELWRRGKCLLSSVHKPAARESAVPKDIGRTPVLRPQLYARQGALLCYAVDGATVWVADDQGLYQADGASGKLIRRIGRADGLPDAAVQSIAPTAECIWLATRSGLAALNAKTARVTVVPEIRFSLARLAAGTGGVWLVSDAGAYRLAPGKRTWRKLPDFPSRRQLSGIAGRGFWSANWRRRMLDLIPSMFANDDGLYVIVLNRLLRYDPRGDQWKQVCGQAWGAKPQGRAVWVLTTGGVSRYDPSSGKTEPFRAGSGPAAGRPVAIAPAPKGLFVISEPDYDSKAKRFVGGGISRFDSGTGKWTITETVDGADIRFAGALLADGEEAWVACTLYDRVVRLGAHPGMAHVERWRPHASGLGLLRYHGRKWSLMKRTGLKTEKRWVMGQRNTAAPDRIGPESVEGLCRCGDRVWGIYRMVPEQYYAGYYISAGCLASRSAGRWEGAFDVRTDELGLAGEQPALMLVSHSHGERVVLAEGHPIVLGIEQVAGRAWAVCESGLYVHDAGADKFVPVVVEGPRFYWRATAAGAGEEAVWFGGDGGTISRLDRRTGRLELHAVVRGRKVVSIGVSGKRVVVRTAKTTAVLPVCLQTDRSLPDADTLVYDGEGWSAGSARVAAAASAYSCRKKTSYLYKGEKRVGFLKGVFRPIVLCEDTVGGKLWLSTYSGVAAVSLPVEAAK